MRHLALLVFGLLYAGALHAASAVDYVALSAEEGRFDCDADVHAVCRRRGDRVDYVAAMLERGETVRREGDQLVFAFRGEADAVQMNGGLQYPLSRVIGTNHWTVALRVDRLDELAFEFAFVTLRGTLFEHGPRSIWRGPRAAVEPPMAQPLRGRLREHVLNDGDGSKRKVSVYEPPVAGPLRGTVYLADGQDLPRYARFVEPLILSGELPALLLVGLHAGSGAERHVEYVAALRGGERFAAHERFVLHEVLPYIERTFAVPAERISRVLAGSSNGADWAIETSLRHPERFAGVIAYSVAWTPRIRGRLDSARGLRFELAAGQLESDNLRRTQALHRALYAAGVSSSFEKVNGGHDGYWWQRRFPTSLRAHFAPGGG